MGRILFFRGKLSESLGARRRTFRTHNPLPYLSEALARFQVQGDPRVPFCGGAVGYLSYECGGYLEPRRPVAYPDGSFPSMHFIFFDKAVVFDHTLKKTYLVYAAHGRVSSHSAQNVLDRMERALAAQRPHRRRMKTRRPEKPFITTSLNRAEFVRRVKTIKESIAAGEIFQANLAQLIQFNAPSDLLGTYARLKEMNPSPFFGMLNTGDEQILSGSPERLLRLQGRVLDTRPIAGTRPRGANRTENEGLSRELFLSAKERAEHVMLVDLERNDLGRVCEPGSVRVGDFMVREQYSHVQHIVSNVEGVLRPGLTGVEALAAFFPGGTITGAPKIRSMEVIRELEPVPRGPYTGSFGYLSFSGGMDLNILIRSVFVQGGRAYLGAGAGIVADSDPDKEYDETLHKAEAVLRAACGEARAGEYLRKQRIS